MHRHTLPFTFTSLPYNPLSGPTRLNRRLIRQPKTLRFTILVHALLIKYINQRLPLRTTELPLVARTHNIALSQLQIFSRGRQFLFTSTLLPIFHARNGVTVRSAEADAGFHIQRSRQRRGRRSKKRRSFGAIDSGVEAAFERVVAYLLDHSRRDLECLGRIPNTEVLLRTTNFRFVAWAGSVAFTVLGSSGFFLDG